MTLKEAVLYCMYTYRIPLTTSDIRDFVQTLKPVYYIDRCTVGARVCELQDLGILEKMNCKIVTHKRREHLIRLTQKGYNVVDKMFDKYENIEHDTNYNDNAFEEV